jgi:subtilisin-like proprotein convertase family protein
MKSIFYLLFLTTVTALNAGLNILDTRTINAIIPDNSPVGVSDTQTVTLESDFIIESIQVDLIISGGWNGDLYAYLVHGDNTAILLNRVGRTSSNPSGVGSSGMNVSLSDSFASDIHTALPTTGTPSGSFQPDGRFIDPLLVLDTDPRNATLAVFTGADANGDWTLFIADQSSGDLSTIESWGLIINTVPEPSAALLVIIGTAAVALRRRHAS